MVSRCFPGGYDVKLYISRGRLAWWLLAFLRCDGLFICVTEAGVTNRLGTIPSARDNLCRVIFVLLHPTLCGENYQEYEYDDDYFDCEYVKITNVQLSFYLSSIMNIQQNVYAQNHSLSSILNGIIGESNA